MNLGAYKIDWSESEAGWGQRPDGTSLSLTKEYAEEFIRRITKDQRWECYSYPHGIEFVPINEEIYSKLLENKSYFITNTSWWKGI